MQPCRRRAIWAANQQPAPAGFFSTKGDTHEQKDETRDDAAQQREEALPLLNGRKLCPKCGKKPAYHFHVKNCKG